MDQVCHRSEIFLGWFMNCGSTPHPGGQSQPPDDITFWGGGVHTNFDLPLLLGWGVDPIYEAIVVVSKRNINSILFIGVAFLFQHLFSGRAICVFGTWAVFWPLIFSVPRVWMLGMGEEVKPVECPKCDVNHMVVPFITSLPFPHTKSRDVDDIQWLVLSTQIENIARICPENTWNVNVRINALHTSKYNAVSSDQVL